MADKIEEPKPDDNNLEKKIPVFTVIKNGSILKNIFLIDNPPAFHSLNSTGSVQTGGRSIQELEEILVVGRHPDCNITLEHPSISRYHLRIHSKPSSHSLSIIDLSSVHGTWVSGKKIEPGILVELEEGDTVRLGGSSRVYKLHWVPLNRAYDLDRPFFPPLDKSIYCEEEKHQDENCLCAETVEMQLLNDNLEGLDLLFSNENHELSMEKMSPLAHLVPDYLKSTRCDEGEVQNKTQLSKDQEECETSCCSKQLESDMVLPENGSVLLVGEETENAQPPLRCGITSEIENAESHCTKELLSFPNIWSRRGMVASVQIQTSKSGAQSTAVDVSTDIKPLNQDLKNKAVSKSLFVGPDGDEEEIFTPDNENEAVSKSLFAGPDGDEEEIFTPDKENFTQHSHLVQSFKKTDRLEEIKQSNSCRLSPVKNAVGPCMNDEKEIITTLDEENLENMQHESIFKTLLSSTAVDVSTDIKPLNQDLKNEAVSKSLFVGPDGDEEEIFTPDKENEAVSKSLFVGPDGDEEEIFTPDKENFTQHSHLAQSFKKTDRLEEIKQSNSCRLSPVKNAVGPCMNDEKEIITTLDEENLENMQHESILKTLLSSADGNEDDFFTPDKENFSPKTLMRRYMKQMDNTEVKHSEPVRLSSSKNAFGDISQEEHLLLSSNSCRLSPVKNAVGPCMNDEKEIITTLDEENLENMQHEPIFKTLLSSADGNEEDVFTPDKENFSPKTLMRRYMKQMYKAEEVKRSEPVRLSSSKNVFGDISQEEHVLLSSDRGTRTPKVLQERKAVEPASKNKEYLGSEMTIKRLPFQSLPVISASKTKTNASVLGASRRSCNSVNYARTRDHQNTVEGENKMWTLVVDTNCLLHRESRKALQLLQGVKGTQMIIPKIVIRELDQMKLRASLFRRTTEVSLALQWIEDCMVNTKWWIHVQSPMEEGMPIAPTPRALPLARLTDEWGGSPFSSAQIATPTTEDSILECALFFRRIMIDRQFVLLSSDISLKIKSIAEGVICETAKEFRESLVNPFSERFLWADSSPRGATWSCEDDIVLRERYYHCPLKKPESLKGLKLILLHNSQYKRNHQFNQLKI